MRRVGQRGRATRAGDFLDRDRRAHIVGARAAILLGKGDTHQAQLTHLAERLGGELARLIDMPGLGSDLFLGELAHRLADHALFFG